jgi:hypothetical protein
MDATAFNYQNGGTCAPRQCFKGDYQLVWHRRDWAVGMLHIYLEFEGRAAAPNVVARFRECESTSLSKLMG